MDQQTIGQWLMQKIIESYMPGFDRLDREAEEAGNKDWEDYDHLLDQREQDLDLVEVLWS